MSHSSGTNGLNRRGLVAWLCGFLSFFAVQAMAQVPKDKLEVPPPSAQAYVIASVAGIHGRGAVWSRPDGTRIYRESLNLRGQIWEQDQSLSFGPDHMPNRISIRGTTPQGDAAETFVVEGGKAKWKSQVDAGEAAYGSPAFYVTFGGPFAGQADFLEALLAAPDHSLALLPGGKARAARLAEATVGEGAKAKKVIAWAITGISNSPYALWSTEGGRFFASVGGLSVLPEAYVGNLAALTRAQDEALAQQSPVIAKQFLKVPVAPVAFVHVQTYDAVAKAFLADQTVVVDKGLITAAGPSATVTPPKDARLIDGAGKTLVPGLWDSHQHVGDDFAGPMLLSLGITSARDPGNDNALTLARAARRARGDLLSPHVYPSVLIDGKGPLTAQVATVVENEAQAIAAVDKAKAEGFIAIKLYGSFPLALVKPTIAEAKRLGLHVHGHLPAGMRPSEAIADGYDEITHIYFVMMQAMPDDVVMKSNTILRMQGMGMYAAAVDLKAEPMKGLITTMAQKHITSDPTLVVVESVLGAEAGELSPAYAPYVGTLPPAVERSFKAGGLALMPGYTRAQYRTGIRKLGELVFTMKRAGIQIVAGTDGSGLELVRELELYVEAGMTPAEALETATLSPARLVGKDKSTGSITVGKTADLVLVEGDPSKRIGDLRQTRLVMMDGIPMDADQLRSVSGFAGRPRP